MREVILAMTRSQILLRALHHVQQHQHSSAPEDHAGEQPGVAEEQRLGAFAVAGRARHAQVAEQANNDERYRGDQFGIAERGGRKERIEHVGGYRGHGYAFQPAVE